jgi:hypothetical protein
MCRRPKTGTNLPHPSVNFRGSLLGRDLKADGLAVASASQKRNGAASVICGLAGLALAAVPGVSFTSGAPMVVGREPILVVTRPGAIDMAVFVDRGPFNAMGCAAGTASLR